MILFNVNLMEITHVQQTQKKPVQIYKIYKIMLILQKSLLELHHKPLKLYLIQDLLILGSWTLKQILELRNKDRLMTQSLQLSKPLISKLKSILDLEILAEILWQILSLWDNVKGLTGWSQFQTRNLETFLSKKPFLQEIILKQLLVWHILN